MLPFLKISQHTFVLNTVSQVLISIKYIVIGLILTLFHFSIHRKKAGNGLWLLFLVPVTLIVTVVKYSTQCSFLYWHFSLLSISFLINSTCGVLHYANKCQLPLKQIGVLASMTTTSLLLTLYSFEGV